MHKGTLIHTVHTRGCGFSGLTLSISALSKPLVSSRTRDPEGYLAVVLHPSYDVGVSLIVVA